MLAHLRDSGEDRESDAGVVQVASRSDVMV